MNLTQEHQDWLTEHGATLRVIGGYFIVIQPGKHRRTYETAAAAIEAAMNEEATV